MFPTSFDESNTTLSPPEGMTEDEVQSLAIWRGNTVYEGGLTAPTVISCWKPTKEEMEEFQRTGRVWLIICGYTMPPASLSLISPFKS